MGAALIFARQALSAYIMDQAAKKAAALGFGWVAVESGMPETYEELIIEVQWCQSNSRAFRVWSGGSDKTIYSLPSVNHAFRFWHDMHHWDYNLSMSYADELELGARLAAQVAARFCKESLEYKLFVADTIGQSTHNELTGAFPEDQLAFALNLIGYKK